MADDENLRAKILFGALKGDIDRDAASAMLSVLSGAPIFRVSPSEEDKALGKGAIYHALDTNGNVLVSGENYTYRNNTVKVLKEEFGAGNFLDTFVRIYYLDSSLETKCDVIDAKYPKGVLKGAIYQSNFEPIVKK